MTDAPAPFPFYDMYTDHIELQPRDGKRSVFQTNTSLPAMDDFTWSIWSELEPKLSELDGVQGNLAWNARLTAPARIEVFLTEHKEGLAIFDSRGQLVVHAIPARLGNDGYGAELSLNIMRLLGVSEEMIEAMQSQLRDVNPYQVVVSRELMSITDKARATLSDDVAPEWVWWDVA